MIGGYGVRESRGRVCCEWIGDLGLGGVGGVVEGVEVGIGENKEIEVGGGRIRKGYYKKEGIREEGFREDGWLGRGDGGYMKDGLL